MTYGGLRQETIICTICTCFLALPWYFWGAPVPSSHAVPLTNRPLLHLRASQHQCYPARDPPCPLQPHLPQASTHPTSARLDTHTCRGSWDVLGVYPESTTSQGSYRDPAVLAMVQDHNARVASGGISPAK